MAVREISINSVLCFIFNSIRKYPTKIVKSITLDFYDNDSINHAKDILSSDIDKLEINIKLPPKRRGTNDNKCKLDLEDIINMFQAVDESSSLDKLPRYATDNLDELPITRMDTGGLSVVMAKLDSINEKLDSVGLQVPRALRPDNPQVYMGECSHHGPSTHPSIGDAGMGVEGMTWAEVAAAGDSTADETFEDVINNKRKSVV